MRIMVVSRKSPLGDLGESQQSLLRGNKITKDFKGFNVLKIITNNKGDIN